MLVLFAGVMVIVDPYFHYHAPLNGISYRLYEERYINDGIARNFEYDAIITGTSMTQNFKTSEFDELFDCSSIKLPFSGAGYREVSQSLQRAFSYNKDIQYVLWGLDSSMLIKDSEYQGYEEYPDYLYDANIFNDVYYVLNKTIMYKGCLNNILWTLQGKESTTFDQYSAWERETGLEVVLSTYVREENNAEARSLSEAERVFVENNIRDNVCSVVEANPNTTFYIFFTPYSIVYWDHWSREGIVAAQIEAEAIATDLLLQYPNVELYCFYENEDLVLNLGNYKDYAHYSAEVNSQILLWIKNRENQLTNDNCQQHEEYEKELYIDYNYDELFD